MSHPNQRLKWFAAACVPLLFVCVAVLQTGIDAGTRTAAQEKDELLLSSPSAVRKISLGYDALLADIYWTRAVQYYGSRVGTDHPNFDLLWPLLDITTTLDPKLVIAYRFGAVFLSETGRGGAGRTDLAIKLVKRGIAANPDQWELGADLGFLYYWRMGDYPDAAAAYLEASKIPNAPLWLKIMAARVAQKGGSLETSRMIWSQLYESTQNRLVKKRAEEMLRGLKAQEDETQLNELASEYRKRFGRFPLSAAELRDAGLLRGIPIDPDGYPYTFGPDGKSQLNPQSSVVIPPEIKAPPAQVK
jgi:tetratricopeptide (TPR) repeat protein